MLTDFRIKIDSPRDMIVTREVLRSLGYPIYKSLDDAENMFGYDYLVRREELGSTQHIQRSFGSGISNHYATLTEFLYDHFKPTHEAEKEELGELESQVISLNARIKQLKEIING